MAAPKTIHITQNYAGLWLVRVTGGAHVGTAYSTQAEAVRAAQAVIRETGGQLHVSGADGQARKSFTLGRAAIAKLNAVEGVALTPAGRSAFRTFDREDLTPAQRRATLRKDLSKLAGTAKAKKRASGARAVSAKV
jgi:hypothetical protein